ncbi:MAG: InlB B-repeat-containing protein [Clostridia bacterium]|nr:InlB B-repeat-containing protein [Clostridia bacterium]
MNNHVLKSVSFFILLLVILLITVCCNLNGNDPTADPTEDPTQTTDETEVLTGNIFDIRSDGQITARLNGHVIDVKVPSSISLMNLEAYATPRSDVEWKVSKSVTGGNYIENKRLTLIPGDNIYYVFCTDKYGQTTNYTLIIKRAESCIVTFEGIDERIIVDQGSFIYAPAEVPTKQGYVFKKWNYDFAVPVSSNITVTAVFDPVYYEITFDPRLGTMNNLKLKVTYGEEVELETPVRTGFIFAGWYCGDEAVKSGVWTRTENVTLVAQWVNRPFKVTLDPAGGTVDGKAASVELEIRFGDELTLPVPARPGYGFGGWFSGDKLVESGVFEYTDDIVLTAKWNERSATITFVENGGNGGMHTETVRFDAQLPVPVRAGFTFGGWYSDEKLTVEVTEVPQVEEPIRLYAWWSEEGKPTEFIYELSGLNYKITDRLDRTSTTLIPAYIGGLAAIDAVERENPNARIEITKKTLTIKIDRSAQIEAVCIPKFTDDDTTLVYESSNPLIATVDENGLVTGVNANLGTCTITVTNPASGMTEFCFIAVLADVKNPDASLTLESSSVQLTLGESMKLNAVYIPEYEDDDRTLIYESSNELIASVDAAGNITANFLGECVITVKTVDGSFSAECRLEVVNEKFNDDPGIVLSAGELTLNTGWIKTVTAVYTPRIVGADATVEWESDDPAVATVEDGTITALTPGTCTVTVRSADGEYSATVTVSVLQAGVYIDRADAELVAGTAGEFKVFVLPDTENGSTAVVYLSSDETVATVSGGVITAHAAGQCTLTAQTPDGKYSVTTVLTVTAPKPEFAIHEADGVTVEKTGSVFRLTVTGDVTFLQLSKLVEVRSGYSWILAKDVEMSEIIVNKAVSVPETGSVTVYAYCHSADDVFMETYMIEITRAV